MEASARQLGSFLPLCTFQRVVDAAASGLLDPGNLSSALPARSVQAAVVEVNAWVLRKGRKVYLDSEELSHLEVDLDELNDVLSSIISTIRWNLGSILQMTNGTLIVAWIASDMEETLFSATWRAVQCAFAISSLRQSSFRFSCNLGAGPMQLFTAGSLKCYNIVSGCVPRQISFVGRARRAKGSVQPFLVSRQAWPLVETYVEGNMLIGFHWAEEEYLFEVKQLLREISHPVLCSPKLQSPLSDLSTSGSSIPRSFKFHGLRSGDFPRLLLGLTTAIPEASLRQLGSTPGSPVRPPEIRDVTVVSVLLSGLTLDSYVLGDESDVSTGGGTSSSDAEVPSFRGFSPPECGDGPLAGRVSFDSLTASDGPYRSDSPDETSEVDDESGKGVVGRSEEEIQWVVDATLRVLDHYGGHLYNIRLDEHGTTLVVVFGLYPSGEGDASRAVSTSQALQRNIGPDRVRIGIATGPVLCSVLGTKTRREFCLFGSVLHRARRISVLNPPGARELQCDEPTYKRAHKVLEHVSERHRGALAMHNEDGLAGGVVVEGGGGGGDGGVRNPSKRPTAAAAAASAASGVGGKVPPRATTTTTPPPPPVLSAVAASLGHPPNRVLPSSSSWGLADRLPRGGVSGSFGPPTLHSLASRSDGPKEATSFTVGRLEERKELENALDALEGGNSCMYVIEGFPGIGKTNLLDATIASASSHRRIHCYVGTAVASEVNNPYYAWLGIFRKALREGSDLYGQLRAGGLQSIAALLNPVLGTSFPPTPTITCMSTAARMDKTRDLLLYTLQHLTRMPKVFVLEDTQWMDSLSWNLLRMAVRTLPPAVFIITQRVSQLYTMTPLSDQLAKLKDIVRAARIPLHEMFLRGLSPQDSIGLAERVLHHRYPREHLYMLEKAKGHPLLIIELSLAMESNGWELSRGLDDSLAIEDDAKKTVGIIARTRMDHLPREAVVTLKVMSVLARASTLVALDAVVYMHPRAVDKEDIRGDVKACVWQYFLRPAQGSPYLPYAPRPPPGSDRTGDVDYFLFQNDILLETVYQSIPSAQRQRLHLAAAEYCEMKAEETRLWWMEDHDGGDGGGGARCDGGDDDGDGDGGARDATEERHHHLGRRRAQRVKHHKGYRSVRSVLAVIARHSLEGRDLVKATEFYQRAGQLAFDHNSIPEGVRLLEQAFVLATALEEHFPVERRVRWARMLGEWATIVGELDVALKYTKAGLELLGKGPRLSEKASYASMMANLVSSIARTYVTKQLPSVLGGSCGTASPGFAEGWREGTESEAGRLLQGYSELLFWKGGSDLEAGIFCLEAFLVLDHTQQASATRPLAWAATSYTLASCGLDALSNRLMGGAMGQVGAQGLSPLHNMRLLVWGTHYMFQTLQWDAFVEYQSRARIMMEEDPSLDPFSRAQAMETLDVFIPFVLGRVGEAAAAIEHVFHLLDGASHQRDLQIRRFASVFSALCLLYQGEAARALEALLELERSNSRGSSAAAINATSIIITREGYLLSCIKIGCYMSMGQYNRSRAALSEMIQREGKSAFSYMHTSDIHGLRLIAESVLTLWEIALKIEDRSERNAQIKQYQVYMEYCLRKHAQMRKSSKVLETSRLRLKGQYYFLQQKPRKAISLWQKALKSGKYLAVQLLELGKTHLLLARHGGAVLTDAQRSHHLRESKMYFSRAGACQPNWNVIQSPAADSHSRHRLADETERVSLEGGCEDARGSDGDGASSNMMEERRSVVEEEGVVNNVMCQSVAGGAFAASPPWLIPSDV